MNPNIENQALKIGAVWTAWGLTSWSEVAGFLAAILSALALGEWLWKKAVRPFLIYMGYMKYRRPNRRDSDEWGTDDK